MIVKSQSTSKPKFVCSYSFISGVYTKLELIPSPHLVCSPEQTGKRTQKAYILEILICGYTKSKLYITILKEKQIISLKVRKEGHMAAFRHKKKEQMM